jgi:F420-dependent oxidoreductase-like protein
MIEGQEGVSWAQWRALAHACEAHGIPALFRSDHYMNLDGRDPSRASLDAWATLNALAAITESLRLGTMVSPTSFRHPSVLAKQVVTADHVSGGRVELGLGAGWHEREHEAYGFPFGATRERMDVLEEQLAILVGSWGEAPFDFVGTHYTLRGLEAHPKPVQQPHPPLILGGVAGPRSASLAARYADEYNTVFPSAQDIRERRERLERACEQAGRAPLPLSVMTAVLVGETEDELRARARRRGEKEGTNGDALLAEPPHGWIVGTVQSAAEQLIALREAGVSRVMCQHLIHEDLDMVALIGERLAPLVA